jgi:ATP-dependent RNA helicase DeaD
MSDQETVEESLTFADLGLPANLLKAIEKVGYEAPSPIQAAAIPALLDGRDLIGQAQTGTGKTAAFSLPLLAAIDLKVAKPQLLVLTPTRELALQVAEAIQTYAHDLKNLHVLPVYGGQGMEVQLRSLRRGVHVIVGTPGRIQDHLRRRTLDLSGIKALVLDEADEMLRMGFVEEVEAILEETPAERQTALFSATMPRAIQSIAQRFLRDPEHVQIAAKTATVDTINQRYVAVTGYNKLEALTRILEVEDFDAMLIFVRTRSMTMGLTEKLEARGFAASPLSGEMSQDARQRTVDRLKKGKLDVIVCTDVAARGLDVERVTHVVNYDIPIDPEAYVHRIGRTGRAGRKGEAILFVARRERRLLQTIERRTRQPIERMAVPTGADIGKQRINQLKEMLTQTIDDTELGFFEAVVESYLEERADAEGDALELSAQKVAAALIYRYQRERPLVVAERRLEDDDRGQRQQNRREGRDARVQGDAEGRTQRYRLDVGRTHGLEVRNVVGCIANEAGLASRHIGKIRIHDEYTTVDLPLGMPNDVVGHLGQAWVCGRQLRMKPIGGGGQDSDDRPRGKWQPKTDARDDRPRGPQKRAHRGKPPQNPYPPKGAGAPKSDRPGKGPRPKGPKLKVRGPKKSKT